MSDQLDDWIAESITRRAAAFADQLRGCRSGGEAVPGLEWTVTDLAQHVACLPDFWERQHTAAATFERPTDFAAFSDAARAHITETDPAALAELIESVFAGYVDTLGGSDGTRWLYARQTSAEIMGGLSISELTIHGWDLAGVTGATRPRFDRREANLAVEGIMVTTEFFVDEARAAAQPDGVYHLGFRGGRDYTWTKQGGTLRITDGRPARADARMRADPAVFLMSALGRWGQLRAGLTGGMIAYGRKPWRFLGLGTIAADGV